MSKTRNILMLVSSDLDHDPRVQKEALSAHQAGHNVTVFCRTASESFPFQVKAANIQRVQKGTLRKLLERIRFFVRASGAVEQDRPDVVHANDLDMLPLGWILARRHRARLVYDAHELWTGSRRHIHPIVVRLAHHLEKFLASRAEAVVTVSAYLADVMSQTLEIPRPHIVLNAPVSQDIYKVPAPRSILEELKLPETSHVVLYQGRYVPERGIEESILSAKYLPDNVFLVLRGYGPIEQQVRDLVQEEGLEGRVHFVPPVPMHDLVRYAVGADIGLVPYRPTNLNHLGAAPNKLFEYIMAGVPIAAADMPSLRQIVLSERIGMVFDPSNPQNLATTIQKMLSDPVELEAMARRSLQASSKYCWEREYEKLDALYSR